MMVPATDVLSVIQCTLCLIEKLQSLHLKPYDRKSWSPLTSHRASLGLMMKDTLFGEEFQASFTGKVEKDVASSKAVSILK